MPDGEPQTPRSGDGPVYDTAKAAAPQEAPAAASGMAGTTDASPTQQSVAPRAPKPPAKGKARGRRRSGRRGAPKPSGGRVGAEPKLSDQKIAAIAQKIEEGNPIETAAALCGVSPRAAIYWLAMGRAIVEQVKRATGADPGQVTGEEPEATSPWPKLPAPLLVRYLRNVERARAEDEQRRVAAITASGNGGATVYEKTVEVVNERTGTKTISTERRLLEPDWRAHAFLLERRDPDRWGRQTRFDSSAAAATGARPGLPNAGGGKVPELLDVIGQAWALIEAHLQPTPALPPATVIDGQAVPAG